MSFYLKNDIIFEVSDISDFTLLKIHFINVLLCRNLRRVVYEENQYKMLILSTLYCHSTFILI